ncbi:hypothetical protein PG984_007247 [Apiospora sp. TS-2023a]
MDATEFQVLLEYGEGFVGNCNISCLLYRSDVDKAVDAEFKDADKDGSYEEFLQVHSARRLQVRKRKYDDLENHQSPGIAVNSGPSEGAPQHLAGSGQVKRSAEPTKTKTTSYHGDVFIVDKTEARKALLSDEDVWEVWLTNPKNKYNAHDEKKRSFLTLWVSEAMGKELGSRSKLM